MFNIVYSLILLLDIKILTFNVFFYRFLIYYKHFLLCYEKMLILEKHEVSEQGYKNLELIIVLSVHPPLEPKKKVIA